MNQAIFESAFRQYREGNLSEAERLCHDLLANDPCHAQGLCLQGIIARRNGQNADAIQFITRALEKEPANPNFWNSLGLAVEGLGHRQEAIGLYKQGLQFQNNHAELLGNLASSLAKQGLANEAETYFLRGLANGNAPAPELYTNYGNFLISQGQPEDAIHQYRKATQADRKYWLAYFNWGNACFQSGEYEQAIHQLEKTIQLNPGFEQAYFYLAQAYKQIGMAEKEIGSYERLATYNPRSVFAWSKMGIWYEARGHITQATSLYQKIAEFEPEQFVWQLRAASLMPMIPASAPEIEQARTRLADALQQYKDPTFRLDLRKAFEARCQPPAVMSYQGLDDKEIKSQFADWLVEKLGIDTRKIPAKPLENRKIKIGFLVTENHERIFNRVMGGYIRHLDRTRFQVEVICPESRMTGIQHLFSDVDDLAFIPLPSDISQCVSTLKQTNLDVLFFFEVGTDVKNYLLSLYRFAPVQCTSWGYPTTSGSPNMDYYISSRLIETPDAAKHYRERLVLLDSLPTYYTAPAVPENYKTRASLNLPEQAHLYVCPQTLLKFHPDFDALLSRILTEDPQGHLVLVEGLYPAWTDALKARFNKTLYTFQSRIHFLPQLQYEDYLALLKNADVLLDTPHFGGGITTYETMALGVLVVTLPGEYMRARYTAGCYQKMGINDCIATSHDEYVSLAIQIASNQTFRQEISEKILAQKHLLFEDINVIREMEETLAQLVDEASR